MMNRETNPKPALPNIAELSLVRKPNREPALLSTSELRTELAARAEELARMATSWAQRDAPVSFKEFEQALRTLLFAVGRAAIALFLALREQHVMKREHWGAREARRFRAAPAQARSLATMFGVVRYARTYMRQVGDSARRGFYPLDASLGLLADRFSWNVLSLATRLATKLSFAEARATLSAFVPNAPSTEVIEGAVLGLGRHTAAFIEQAPPPAGDGDVLIIMIDSKGAPTATDSELSRRRGKRSKRRRPASPRHRGRAQRARYPAKRRSKGDKSKNAKMATMVVMYTLRRCGANLLGPLNRRRYASFAPKRHAFAFARREANKRGFSDDAGKLVQIVTDGDDDLAIYAAEYFPRAMHTIDVMHVVERLWSAAQCLHREGSPELRAWVEAQKERLYGGRVQDILDELGRRLLSTPRTGPGNKGKRERLAEVVRYLEKRGDKMRYDEILAADLELGTGSVEGAIKNIIGKRFDHGGMRWIKERAEALLQLGCIEANGQWDVFIDYAHDELRSAAIRDGTRTRLQSRVPARLPQAEAA
jgi:hypothetical protein